MKTSIKIKWTVFIILLLVVNLVIISFFMLRGIQKNQIKSYETLLMDKSKTANLYIREKFVSSDYENFEEFYIHNAEEIVMDLGRILDLPNAVYDMNGDLLASEQNDIKDKQKLSIMDKAIKNKIVYEKNGDRIVYIAPLYDFESQIGVLKFEYYAEKERIFYEDIKDLFCEVGMISIPISYFLGVLYFSRVVKGIVALKKSIKEIEKGNYESVIVLDDKDELGDLSNGIYFMSGRIRQTIMQINTEKEKLELALRKLKKLESQQKEFIGNVTHEFKTPLTVIKAQIDLMSLYRDDEDMINNSKKVAEKELKRLDSMVENTLHLFKIEKYDFELKKEKINTREFLMDICSRMDGKASKFGIDIIQNIEDAYIFMDAESFMQIFINLIDNAIKYNVNGGKIYIRSYVSDDKNYIEIEDTGIGIPYEHRRRIFEPFYTVDKNRSKKFSGTGLGLSLVNSLVKRQSGEINILDIKEGTCFEVIFPVYDYKE